MCLKCIDSIKIGKSYSFKFKKYLISTITMNCQIFNFPNLELAIVLTDDSINVKEKRLIHCKLYTVKSAQVIRFRPRLFK